MATEAERRRNRKWAANNPERMRAYARKSARKARRLPQPTRPAPSSCECCGKTELSAALCLDHCHETGQFRGWLCHECNQSIGKLGDNSFMVARAVRYLQRAEAVTHPDVSPLIIP